MPGTFLDFLFLNEPSCFSVLVNALAVTSLVCLNETDPLLKIFCENCPCLNGEAAALSAFHQWSSSPPATADLQNFSGTRSPRSIRDSSAGFGFLTGVGHAFDRCWRERDRRQETLPGRSLRFQIVCVGGGLEDGFFWS